ncbi:hypothetical protein JCM12296A_08700 [Desulfosarcina cetonica]
MAPNPNCAIRTPAQYGIALWREGHIDDIIFVIGQQFIIDQFSIHAPKADGTVGGGACDHASVRAYSESPDVILVCLPDTFGHSSTH